MVTSIAPGEKDAMRVITGVTFAAVYVDDLQKAIDFYSGLLGLERGPDMGSNAAYLMIGPDIGLYIEGGAERSEVSTTSTRASFGLAAASVDVTYRSLQSAGVRIVQASGPLDMGNGQ